MFFDGELSADTDVGGYRRGPKLKERPKKKALESGWDRGCGHTYSNVIVDGVEFEHYDRLGPGCWHRVTGTSQCFSLQSLIREAEWRAYDRGKLKGIELEDVHET